MSEWPFQCDRKQSQVLLLLLSLKGVAGYQSQQLGLLLNTARVVVLYVCDDCEMCEHKVNFSITAFCCFAY